MKPLKDLSLFCNTWVERSLAILGFGMAGVVLLQVIFRYVFNNSLFWSEELARYLLVWLTFLGASCAYYRRVHPGIDLLTCRLNQKTRKAIEITVHAVSLCLFLVMIYYGTLFAYFVRLQISPALSIPKWIIFVVIPLSGILFSLHCIAFISSALTRQDHHDR
jgi:TRAP-type C4-dicarboxylate transport system permease small subunit